MATHHVLTRLAHDVLRGADTRAIDAGELKDRLKRRAAETRIPYDCGAVTRALDAALHQRERRHA
jgi:hypothetical protein